MLYVGLYLLPAVMAVLRMLSCSALNPYPRNGLITIFPLSWALATAYFFLASMYTGSFRPLALAYFSIQHILHFSKKECLCYFIFYGLFYGLSLLQHQSFFTFSSLPLYF